VRSVFTVCLLPERDPERNVRQIYDRIGVGYTHNRRADPRIASKIVAALGDAATVVNVGAGTGSYEPLDRPVVAVEPSWVMIRQRPADSAPVVRASSAQLPFRDGAFSAALAVLTVHHWRERTRGLAELARVAREGVVMFTWDPDSSGFWLVQDYFPDLLALSRRVYPKLGELRKLLGPLTVVAVPIPHDCTDGFFGAYWRRPHAYLDERIRAGISTFANAENLEARLRRLRTDLDDGTWERRHGDLLDKAELDIGYRIVASNSLAMALLNATGLAPATEHARRE
jgi:SAM-dependent methyltransferase